MSELADRRRTSAVTLGVFAVVLVVMAVWGYQAATAPFDDLVSSTSDGPECAPEDQAVIRVIRRAEVTVSVYNAGERTGRAQSTLDLLEAAGFRPGAIGNAPDDVEVTYAEVRTTREDNPAAQLVAAAFGAKAKIVVVDEDYGPGIDVFIGDKFSRLKVNAPTKVSLPEPETICS